jgi:hypothetical protein
MERVESKLLRLLSPRLARRVRRLRRRERRYRLELASANRPATPRKIVGGLQIGPPDGGIVCSAVHGLLELLAQAHGKRPDQPPHSRPLQGESASLLLLTAGGPAANRHYNVCCWRPFLPRPHAPLASSGTTRRWPTSHQASFRARQLSAIFGKLLHDLLMQPNVHRTGIIRVA